MKNYKEVKILNGYQVLFYLDRGVQPLRIERGFNDRIVYVYSKEETSELYGLWLDDCKEHRKMLQELEAQED